MGNHNKGEVRGVANKEKLVQIYETIADISLANLKKIKEAEIIPSENDLQMVSATLTLYSAIAEDCPTELFPHHPISAKVSDEEFCKEHGIIQTYA